jgi:hypothetical protein
MPEPSYVVTIRDIERICVDLRAGVPRKAVFANPLNPTRREFAAALSTNPEWQALVDDADREYLVTLAEELVSIADNSDQDTLTRADGTTYANTEWISRSKLRVETRLKLLSKLWPEKFGDKVQVAVAVTLDKLIEAVPVVADPLAKPAPGDAKVTH